LVAVGDEGGSIETEQGRQAMEVYGSTMIRNVGFRDTWGMIFVKGQGVLAEDYGDYDLATGTYHPITLEKPIHIDIPDIPDTTPQ